METLENLNPTLFRDGDKIPEATKTVIETGFQTSLVECEENRIDTRKIACSIFKTCQV